MSCALTYLAAARGRPNLVVQGNVLIDRVDLESGACVGVVTASGQQYRGGQVILSTGAYGSPALLMRSGIGAPEQLRPLGIDVAVELPGVGAGLTDHPLSAVDFPVSVPAVPGPKYQTMLTMRLSLTPPETAPDLHIFPAGPFAAGDQLPTGVVAGLVVGLLKPKSRGWVRLRSADPSAPPRIHLGHLEHEQDLARMIEGMRMARKIAQTDQVRAITAGEELALGAAISDDFAMGQWLRSRVETYHHPVGSCRLGSDAGAVVDRQGRVHGVDRLRVVDASIMPQIPSANTNLPTIMLAKRISTLID